MTTLDFSKLATPGVQSLMPYQPGKPLDELEREYGISEAIKLASNENPLGPSPRVREAITTQLGEIARYPDGNGFSLKKALSSHLGVDAESITLGNGSNDILELLTRAFVTPEHEILFSQHAFAVYPIVTQAVGASAVVVPAKNWGNDLDAIKQAITNKTRMIFIANPNNPTGTWLAKEDLELFLKDVPENVLVILDEAYFEYANDPSLGAENYPDGIQLLNNYKNLVVTRTFSKAYGLAGLRIGYSVSDPQVADILNRVRQPFNVNSLALVAAEAALADKEYLQQCITVNAQGMEQITLACNKLELDYIPSVANFISIKVGDNAMQIYDDLLHEGVIVRPVANYEMPEHLRISIGNEEENARFIEALTKILAK